MGVGGPFSSSLKKSGGGGGLVLGQVNAITHLELPPAFGVAFLASAPLALDPVAHLACWNAGQIFGPYTYAAGGVLLQGDSASSIQVSGIDTTHDSFYLGLVVNLYSVDGADAATLRGDLDLAIAGPGQAGTAYANVWSVGAGTDLAWDPIAGTVKSTAGKAYSLFPLAFCGYD